MSKNIIGIKQADGTFYPILTRGNPAKKRLQITTASDNQTVAQIKLFCASDESFSDAEYVDTLIIDGLIPQEKQAVNLDFVVELDENDELSAHVYDQESGSSTNTAVSLVTIGTSSNENDLSIYDETAPFDTSLSESSEALDLSDLDDFDFSESVLIADEQNTDFEDEAPDDDLNFDLRDSSLYAKTSVDDDAFADDSLYDKTYEALVETAMNSDLADENDYDDKSENPDIDEEVPDLFAEQTASGGFSDFDFLDPNAGKPKISIVLVICLICAIVSILSCIFIWVSNSKDKQQLQPLVVDKAPAVKYQSVTVVTEKAEPVDAALIDRISSSVSARENSIVIIDAPVVVPAPISKTVSAKDTKDYQIKWGDTLWDIADTFYKNPWMYNKIANANNIKNPDFILSGTWIKIPPQ